NKWGSPYRPQGCPFEKPSGVPCGRHQPQGGVLMDLRTYGWKEIQDQWRRSLQAESLELARVTEEHRGLYRVITPRGEKLAFVAGKFRHRTASRSDYP